jgi:hypothetical protein
MAAVGLKIQSAFQGSPWVAALIFCCPLILGNSNVLGSGDVRVELLTPIAFGGQWPFAKTAVSIGCEKRGAKRITTLGWEAPPPDGTGDITIVELLATPPYVGKTLTEGRSTFSQIVKPSTDTQVLYGYLRVAKDRADILCRTIEG